MHKLEIWEKSKSQKIEIIDITIENSTRISQNPKQIQSKLKKERNKIERNKIEKWDDSNSTFKTEKEEELKRGNHI